MHEMPPSFQDRKPMKNGFNKKRRSHIEYQNLEDPGLGCSRTIIASAGCRARGWMSISVGWLVLLQPLKVSWRSYDLRLEKSGWWVIKASFAIDSRRLLGFKIVLYDMGGWLAIVTCLVQVASDFTVALSTADNWQRHSPLTLLTAGIWILQLNKNTAAWLLILGPAHERLMAGGTL